MSFYKVFVVKRKNNARKITFLTMNWNNLDFLM